MWGDRGLMAKGPPRGRSQKDWGKTVRIPRFPRTALRAVRLRTRDISQEQGRPQRRIRDGQGCPEVSRGGRHLVSRGRTCCSGNAEQAGS